MTREEIIEMLNALKKSSEETVGNRIDKKQEYTILVNISPNSFRFVIDKLIKVLEQEPCEDTVSRQAVIDMTGLSNWFESSDDYNNFVEDLCKLPPVTPTREKGKWIYHFERDDYNDYENEYYECPFCHDLGGDKYYHYCPVCGNKVKGVEA